MGAFTSKIKFLPEPMGTHSVGCADLQIECNSKDTNPDKGLLIRLYYPTQKCDLKAPENCSRLVNWIHRIEYLKGSASFIGMHFPIFKFLYNWEQGHVYSAALWHAPLLVPENTSLPVLVFSHGMAGCRTVYSSICCDMASRGFLVAAVEHRDRSACWTHWNDPKTFDEIPIEYKKVPEDEAEFSVRNVQVQHRASECLRTLKLMKVLNEGKLLQLNDTKLIKDSNFDWNQFKGKIDTGKCAISGHSFGAATVVQALTEQNDFKFQCGVALDCWMVPIPVTAALQKPTFFLSTEWQWRRNFEKIQEIAHNKHPTYTLKGSVHQSQCDWTFLMEGYWGRKYKSIGDSDPFILHKVNCDLMASFIKDHLEIKDEPSFETVLSRDEKWLSHGFKSEEQTLF